MTSIEQSLALIEQSPDLPQIAEKLAERARDEKADRQTFYRDIRPDQKVEFINGIVVMHSPARARHLEVTGWIFQLLYNYVSVHELGVVHSEKCLCVFPRNDYEPDVVFFGTKKAATFTGDTLKFPPPDLAVEILSSSTEKNDRGIKFEDYAARGVGEYWIVNADESFVEQYLPGRDGYELNIKASSGRLVSSVIKGLDLPVEAMFDAAANRDELRRILS